MMTTIEDVRDEIHDVGEELLTENGRVNRQDFTERAEISSDAVMRILGYENWWDCLVGEGVHPDVEEAYWRAREIFPPDISMRQFQTYTENSDRVPTITLSQIRTKTPYDQWNEFKQGMGDTVNEYTGGELNIDREGVIDLMWEIAHEEGRFPDVRDFNDVDGRPSVSVLLDRLDAGTFNDALEEAGFITDIGKGDEELVIRGPLTDDEIEHQPDYGKKFNYNHLNKILDGVFYLPGYHDEGDVLARYIDINSERLRTELRNQAHSGRFRSIFNDIRQYDTPGLRRAVFEHWELMPHDVLRLFVRRVAGLEELGAEFTMTELEEVARDLPVDEKLKRSEFVAEVNELVTGDPGDGRIKPEVYAWFGQQLIND